VCERFENRHRVRRQRQPLRGRRLALLSLLLLKAHRTEGWRPELEIPSRGQNVFDLMWQAELIARRCWGDPPKQFVGLNVGKKRAWHLAANAEMDGSRSVLQMPERVVGGAWSVPQRAMVDVQ